MPGPATVVTLSASPTAIRANGVSTSILRATVQDANGNAVANNNEVTFATSDGTIDADASVPGDQASTRTSNGIALATLRSSTVANTVATITATVPATARRVRGDVVETVASSDLEPGDLVSVGAGEDVPADGRVTSGAGSLQLALLTGESEPADLAAGTGQALSLGRSGDVLVAITTSGRPPSITAAVHAAHEKDMWVVLLTGRDGGPAADLLSVGDMELRVPAWVSARIHEVHILLIHCLCELIDLQLTGQEG